jgi:glycerophosphoryl diester phosphodiesterase
MEVTHVTGPDEALPSDRPQPGRPLSSRLPSTGFVGHRGLQAAAPENTTKAIAEAGRHAFVMCEVDPAISSDGTWFLMHDETVDRTTDGSGPLSSLLAGEVERLRIVSDPELMDPDEVLRPPRFMSAAREAGYWGMGLNVDGGKFPWTSRLAEELWTMLLAAGIAHRSAISLPSADDRVTFARVVPELPVIWATEVDSVHEDIAVARDLHRHPILAYRSSTLTEDAIRACNAADVLVYAWAADTFRDANRWLRAGVQYVETDCELPEGRW